MTEGVNYTFRYYYQEIFYNYSVYSKPDFNNYLEVKLSNGTILTKGGFQNFPFISPSVAISYVKEAVPSLSS